MAKKPETRLSEQIQQWIRINGGKVIKTHGSALHAGEPDLIGGMVVRGIPVHFAVELKVGDNEPSKLQEFNLERWREVGYITGVPYSLEDFIVLVMNEVRRVNTVVEASKAGGRLSERKRAGINRRRSSYRKDTSIVGLCAEDGLPKDTDRN